MLLKQRTDMRRLVGRYLGYRWEKERKERQVGSSTKPPMFKQNRISSVQISRARAREYRAPKHLCTDDAAPPSSLAFPIRELRI